MHALLASPVTVKPRIIWPFPCGYKWALCLHILASQGLIRPSKPTAPRGLHCVQLLLVTSGTGKVCMCLQHFTLVRTTELPGRLQQQQQAPWNYQKPSVTRKLPATRLPYFCTGFNQFSQYWYKLKTPRKFSEDLYKSVENVRHVQGPRGGREKSLTSPTPCSVV